MLGLSSEARIFSRRRYSCNRKFLGFKDSPANPLFRSPSKFRLKFLKLTIEFHQVDGVEVGAVVVAARDDEGVPELGHGRPPHAAMGEGVACTGMLVWGHP